VADPACYVISLTRMSKLIGGIEGGATHSNIILMDITGKVIATATGPGTNHHMTGMAECQKRIADMVNSARLKAKMGFHQPLDALGLSLSGCEHEETNQELVNGLKDSYPNLSKVFAVGSDTEGSVATTSNCGGITCIAGTGSNTLLLNPDGTRVQCGGWGNLLGDEGSAWKIAHRSIKYCFDDLDNFEEPPFPTDVIWAEVKDHFNIQNQADILDYFYANFDKARIASLCKKISELAKKGDKLSQYVFEEAGMHLAKSVAAVVAKAAPQLIKRDGGIQVLCVGSVWLSWELLKPGFVTWMRKHTEIEMISMMRLTKSMATGACYMAADKANIKVAKDYSNNYTVFYKYDRKAAFTS
jgi:N-acetylglucosamine kinase